ncbi:hypothetical protein D3C80_768770 [compost metagenome]
MLDLSIQLFIVSALFSDHEGVSRQGNVAQSIFHGSQRATAAVHAKRHRTILVAGYPLDQRVLHTCITQIVNERVAEAVEGLPGVSYAEPGLEPTEPFRRCMPQLPTDCGQFGE